MFYIMKPSIILPAIQPGAWRMAPSIVSVPTAPSSPLAALDAPISPAPLLTPAQAEGVTGLVRS